MPAEKKCDIKLRDALAPEGWNSKTTSDGGNKKNTWIHRCAHTETQIVSKIHPSYCGVTKLRYGWARILDVKIRGGYTNLNHTETQIVRNIYPRYGWVTKLRHGGSRILYVKIVTVGLLRRTLKNRVSKKVTYSHGYTQAHVTQFG